MANVIFFFSMLIAIEHIWFSIMGVFRWRKGFGRDFTGFDADGAEKVRGLGIYLSVYSALIGAGLLWGTAMAQYDPYPQSSFFGVMIRNDTLYFIVAAGVLGGRFVNRSLYLLQALPAVVLVLLIWIS